MSGLFNRDNAYNSFMAKAFDLCVLNLIFFITCLPYFTTGASLTAVYSTMLKMTENRGGSVIKMYLSAFKSSFKKSTIMFIIPGIALPVLLFDLLYWSDAQTAMRSAGYISALVMLILWACWMFWLFPLSAAFENTIGNTMKNAAKFAASFAPMTLLISIIGMLYIGWLFFSAMLWPFIPVFALLLLLYPQTLYVNRVFRKYKSEHKEVYCDDKRDI